MGSNIILYFGSFNPVHKGHIAIAKYVVDMKLCDEVWMVISPQNPLKKRDGLIDEQDRMRMVEIAIEECGYSDCLKACNIEFGMPKPSYTIDTLRELMKEYPQNRFSILAGSDNVDSLDKWKEYEVLLDMTRFFIYPRDGYIPTKFLDYITVLDNAPRWNYSSTEVREALESGCDADKMTYKGVLEYINDKKLWMR